MCMGDFRNFPWDRLSLLRRSLLLIGWGMWHEVVFPSCSFWLGDYPPQMEMWQKPGMPQSFRCNTRRGPRSPVAPFTLPLGKATLPAST